MGDGQLFELFVLMAKAMRSDNYDVVVLFESVYHRGNGDFEAGFRESIGLFKQIFGRRI